MAVVNEFDPAGDYNFVIRQGDTFSRGISLTNGTTPVNLTNGTLTLTVAEQASGTAVLSIAATGGTAGTALLTATAAQTAALDAGVYVYDLTLNQNSTVTTILAGQFQVLGQV